MNNKIIKILEPYITRLRLPTHTKLRPREFVIENPNPNQYRVHMRVWDGEKIPGKITKEEKQALFDAAYKEIPEGGEILFPESNPIDYIATRGTVAGLLRLARDPRFLPGNKGVLYYLDKDGLIKTFEGTSFIKKPNLIAKQLNPTIFSSGILDKNNFPIIELIETYPSSGILVPVIMNNLGEIRRIL